MGRYIGLLVNFTGVASEEVLDAAAWSMSDVFIKLSGDLIRAKEQAVFVSPVDLACIPLGALLFESEQTFVLADVSIPSSKSVGPWPPQLTQSGWHSNHSSYCPLWQRQGSSGPWTKGLANGGY